MVDGDRGDGLTGDTRAAFQRAGYGLFGIAAINLLGGMVVMALGEGHQVGLVGSLAFLRALIKLAPAVYVWRGSRAGAVFGIVVLAVDALFDLLVLLSGGFDAVFRLALAGVVILWLRRALRASRPATAGTARRAASAGDHPDGGG